jgi:hypothetical protein
MNFHHNFILKIVRDIRTMPVTWAVRRAARTLFTDKLIRTNYRQICIQVSIFDCELISNFVIDFQTLLLHDQFNKPNRHYRI